MSEKPEGHSVFVGLGNPGKEYSLTRHNIGYLVIQAFAKGHQWPFKEEKQFTAHVAKGKLGNATVHLVLPLTYMNESGRAVRRYLDFYQLGSEELTVVSDEADLPFGMMRLRPEGSAGGHNGLKSIQAHLHTQQYARLRMGIGREQQEGRTLADYVLENFSAEEKEQLVPFLRRGVNVLERLISEEITAVMNTVNIRSEKLNDLSG